MLQRRGWKAISISGDKAQHARTEALSLFKGGSCPLTIATDVAACGLDIPDVEVVINYFFLLRPRIKFTGLDRTGRAGKKDVAHTFFTKENKGLAGELINVLREAGQVVPTAFLNFGTHVKKKVNSQFWDLKWLLNRGVDKVLLQPPEASMVLPLTPGAPLLDALQLAQQLKNWM